MLKSSNNILIIILIFISFQLLYYWYHHFTTVKLAKDVSQKVTQNIYVLSNFLNSHTFTTIKNKLIKYKKYNRSNNFIRKGSGISNNEMRKKIDTNLILNLLDNPETLNNIKEQV